MCQDAGWHSQFSMDTARSRTSYRLHDYGRGGEPFPVLRSQRLNVRGCRPAASRYRHVFPSPLYCICRRLTSQIYLMRLFRLILLTLHPIRGVVRKYRCVDTYACINDKLTVQTTHAGEVTLSKMVAANGRFPSERPVNSAHCRHKS